MNWSQKKRALGAYYTSGNPFKFEPFRQWSEIALVEENVLEPFAGTGQICRLMNEAGFDVAFSLFDIDVNIAGVAHQDCLLDFPLGFRTVISNPPYLSYHFAKRKGLLVDKEYFRGYSSLYFVAIEECLSGCDFVALIVPESFVTSGLFRNRLMKVISLPFNEMFVDTEMPTCLALWGPDAATGTEFWRGNHFVGQLEDLDKPFEGVNYESGRIRFNVIDGQVGLKAIDDTRGPSIKFCLPGEIPAEKIKHSARLVSRIDICNLDAKNVETLIEKANFLLDNWRIQTYDVQLTAFKGTRSDGRFRRRIDFGTARALLSAALRELSA